MGAQGALHLLLGEGGCPSELRSCDLTFSPCLSTADISATNVSRPPFADPAAVLPDRCHTILLPLPFLWVSPQAS